VSRCVVCGRPIGPSDDADNWEAHRCKPVKAFRIGYLATERVICHKDGTVSYYSVSTMSRLRHAPCVLVADEAFIRPECLTRIRRRSEPEVTA